MTIPASFMHLTKSSCRTVFVLASDTIILIWLVTFTATVRALASIDDTQLLFAAVATVVAIQEEILGSKSAKDVEQGMGIRCEPFQRQNFTVNPALTSALVYFCEACINEARFYSFLREYKIVCIWRSLQSECFCRCGEVRSVPQFVPDRTGAA
jgi:hypothetical protein